MSQNILLISVDTVKERSGVHTNVDDKLIQHEIKAAQDTRIEEALGTALFKRLQAGIAAKATGATDGLLTVDEELLLNNYIIDALVWFTVAALPVTATFQIYTKGVEQKTSDNTMAPGMRDLQALSDIYENRAEYYRERLIRYLSKSGGLYPLYGSCGNGDDVEAGRSGFSLPCSLDWS
jgi:hypothetical protein